MKRKAETKDKERQTKCYEKKRGLKLRKKWKLWMKRREEERERLAKNRVDKQADR